MTLLNRIQSAGTEVRPVRISSLRNWNLQREGLLERKIGKKKTPPPETLTCELGSFPQAYVI